MPYASGDSFLRPGCVGIRQPDAGRARKCSCKFIGDDPATTRNAPKRSIAGRVWRKDDRLCGSENGLFQALREEVPQLMKIAIGKEERPRELDTFAAAFSVAGEKQENLTDDDYGSERLIIREMHSSERRVMGPRKISACTPLWKSAT
jgi:hypothetical protein